MLRRVGLTSVLVLVFAVPAAAAADAASSRYKALERKVQKLKEDTWKLERDIALIRGRLMGERGAATITHRNRMGHSFRLLELEYWLDGRRVLSRKDPGLSSLQDLEVARAHLAPGGHTLRVRMYYRGHGYGVFDYFTKYRFTVEESFTFTVAERGAARVVVDGYERGDATIPIRERPAARLRVDTVKVTAPTGLR
jgi:hypothetical protein